MYAIWALIVAMTGTSGAPASGCAGADPAITKVTSAVSRDGPDANHFTLTVAVTNLGSTNQRADVLQSVDIFLDRTKNGEKGIPPLKASQTYSFTYDVTRAPGAGPGTTTVGLRLLMIKPSGTSATDCDRSNDSYRYRF